MLKRLAFTIFCSEPDQYQKSTPEIQGFNKSHYSKTHAMLFLKSTRVMKNIVAFASIYFQLFESEVYESNDHNINIMKTNLCIP